MSLLSPLKATYVRQFNARFCLPRLARMETNTKTLSTAIRNWTRHESILPPHTEAIEARRARWIRDQRLLNEIADGDNNNQSIKRACKASKPRTWCELLAEIARLQRTETALELGTNLGISSAYLASAVQESGGTVTTMEGSESRLTLAREFHQSLGLNNIRYVKGRFQTTLPDTLKTLPPIDLVFIDGHHQHRPTVNYFNQISPYLSTSALVIFDDVRWSKGMASAWRELQADPRFAFTIQIGGIGFCRSL